MMVVSYYSGRIRLFLYYNSGADRLAYLLLLLPQRANVPQCLLLERGKLTCSGLLEPGGPLMATTLTLGVVWWGEVADRIRMPSLSAAVPRGTCTYTYKLSHTHKFVPRHEAPAHTHSHSHTCIHVYLGTCTCKCTQPLTYMYIRVPAQ